MALTINQEKQIRKTRIGDTVNLKAPPVNTHADYRNLAKKVALYRRAQTLDNSEALQKRLLGEIDVLLAKLGAV